MVAAGWSSQAHSDAVGDPCLARDERRGQQGAGEGDGGSSDQRGVQATGEGLVLAAAADVTTAVLDILSG